MRKTNEYTIKIVTPLLVRRIRVITSRESLQFSNNTNDIRARTRKNRVDKFDTSWAKVYFLY